MKNAIWPVADSGGNVVEVDPVTWSMIKDYARKFSKPDDLWEFVRKILENENQVRDRTERHARGDFTPELDNLEGCAHDVGDRLDGPPFHAANEIIMRINDCQAGGFNRYNAGRLQELYNSLVDEVHKTDEMVVKLGGLIRELKEAVD